MERREVGAGADVDHAHAERALAPYEARCGNRPDPCRVRSAVSNLRPFKLFAFRHREPMPAA